MPEFLKALFVNESGNPAPLTYDQFAAKLEGNADIKLANLAGGDYVAKAKHEAETGKLKTERDGLREQLDAANTAIQSYKDMDIDGIKQSAADWEEKYNTETKALNDRLAQQNLDHRADMFMSGYEFSSPAAKIGVRALFDQQKFELGDDGVFKGAKEWMDKLIASEDNKGAFKAVDTPPAPPAPGAKPPAFAPNQPPKSPTKRRSLTEIMAEHNANPNAPINFDA